MHAQVPGVHLAAAAGERATTGALAVSNARLRRLFLRQSAIAVGLKDSALRGVRPPQLLPWERGAPLQGGPPFAGGPVLRLLRWLQEPALKRGPPLRLLPEEGKRPLT